MGARYEFRNLNGHWLTKTFRKEAAKAVFPCLAAVPTLFQPAARHGGDTFCRPLVPNMAKEACVTKDSIGWRLELEDKGKGTPSLRANHDWKELYTRAEAPEDLHPAAHR